jgi:hypothetical protein
MSGSDAHHIPVRFLVRHKLRVLKMRICFCLGLPSLVPEVPECDWAGLARLRYALAEIKRQEKEARAQEPPPGPEKSGIRARCWHPVDRLGRLDLKPLGPPPGKAALLVSTPFPPGSDAGQALGTKEP